MSTTIVMVHEEGYSTATTTHDDGSQIQVTEWPGSAPTVAYRADRWDTWSAPVPLPMVEVAS